MASSSLGAIVYYSLLLSSRMPVAVCVTESVFAPTAFCSVADLDWRELLKKLELLSIER